MAKLTDDGRVVDDTGEWEYKLASVRPWHKLGDGNSKKPGIRETFQAAELARLERIRVRKDG